MTTHNLTQLIGQTAVRVTRNEDSLAFSRREEENIRFELANGKTYELVPETECCENVVIDDVCGDLSWLVGSPILFAEETCNEKQSNYGEETWTFYRIGTVHGTVVIRFFGESNGYYSTSVSLCEVTA